MQKIENELNNLLYESIEIQNLINEIYYIERSLILSEYNDISNNTAILNENLTDSILRVLQKIKLLINKIIIWFKDIFSKVITKIKNDTPNYNLNSKKRVISEIDIILSINNLLRTYEDVSVDLSSINLLLSASINNTKLNNANIPNMKKTINNKKKSIKDSCENIVVKRTNLTYIASDINAIIKNKNILVNYLNKKCNKQIQNQIIVMKEYYHTLTRMNNSGIDQGKLYITINSLAEFISISISSYSQLLTAGISILSESTKVLEQFTE
ncbi:hypothetical protein Goe21_01790 [Bacillus phage vB_BsuM-Goe21]|nr:hypothetical protein Goe21_01790 [Bacillus phage vB_BsuM-Goe21]